MQRVPGGHHNQAEPSDIPLAATLGQALTRLTLEHEAGSSSSLVLAANGLRPLDGGSVRIRELPLRAGVSKEAMAMLTGYLTRRALAERGPGHTIALTTSGETALGNYRDRAAQVADSRLREALEELLARPDLLASGLEPPPEVWRASAPYLHQTARLLADPLAALPWQPMVLHRGGWPDGS